MRFHTSARITMPAIAITVLLSVCASVNAQDFVKANRIESIAILPIVGESVPSTVRESAGTAMSAALKKERPDIKVMDHKETADILKRDQRLEDLASFLNLFVKTGTINEQALARCGDSLGSHVLLIEVHEYTERGGSWIRGRSGQNTARVQYTLFTKNGVQMWQTLESLHRSQLTTTVAPMEEIMDRVATRAIKALSEGKENRDVKQKRGGRVIL